MSDNSSIEWCDATWNPVSGCDEVSPGCDHCYAKTFAERWRGTPGHYFEHGFDVRLRPDKLDQPLRWRKPRRIFVNSMSDLFHDQVPDDYIARVFAVMALAEHHTFQCLTKRHARMRALLNSIDFRHAVQREIDAIKVDQEHDPSEIWAAIPDYPGYWASSHGNVRSVDNGTLKTHINSRTGRLAVTLWNRGAPKTLPIHRLVLTAFEPAPLDGLEVLEVCHRNGNKLDNRRANLRWGTASENQLEKVAHGQRGGPAKITARDAERIRDLRGRDRSERPTQQEVADEYGVSRPLISLIESGKVWAPPALEWPLSNVHLGVSAENQQWADIRIPALLDTPAAVRFVSAEPLLGPINLHPDPIAADAKFWLGHLDWVIVGGESGPGARPMQWAWARDLRDQCAATGVAFHFKQSGSVLAREAGYRGKGTDPAEWPEPFPRQYPPIRR